MRPWLLSIAVLIPLSAAAQKQKGDGKPPMLFHTPARQAIAGESFIVEGLLVDGKKIDRVYLRYRPEGEPFRTAEMEVSYGDLYRGAVPAKAMRPPWLEYFVQAVTFDGKPVLLYQSDRKPTRVKVTTTAQPLSRVEPLVAPPSSGPDAGTPGGRRSPDGPRPRRP